MPSVMDSRCDISRKRLFLLCLDLVDSSPRSLAAADDIKVRGVVLDRRLSFHKHVSAVARSCNYHAQAIRHIRHLLTTELAQTLACSLIQSRIDYCNAVLHGAPSYSIKKLQRVGLQNNAARIVLGAPRRSDANSLLKTLHWLPVQQRIEYKVALLSPQHLDAVVPATPNPGSRTRPQPAIDHYGAVSTFHDDDICETRFSMLCISCLEHTTANCSQK